MMEKWGCLVMLQCLFVEALQQSGQIAESGSQTRLPDVAVLPTMLYGCNVLDLNFKPQFDNNCMIF